MTRIQGAEWRPIKENATEPLITATQLIFHSAVTKADSLWGYFQQDRVVVESHLYVDHLGTMEQYIDLDRQADANCEANVRAISVETWDNGDPNHVPWNEAQMHTLVDIAVQVHRLKGVPLLRAPRWNSPGMGGHSDFHEWNLNNHSCPGAARKGQIDVILNRARAILRKPAPVRPPQSKIPPFPLPPGHWYGPANGGGMAHDHGEGLKIWQTQMRRRGWNINPDGRYGKETAKVAKAFQIEKHLVADSLIGKATWNAAWTASVTR